MLYGITKSKTKTKGKGKAETKNKLRKNNTKHVWIIENNFY